MDKNLTKEERIEYEIEVSSYIGLLGDIGIGGGNVVRMRERLPNVSPALRDAIYFEIGKQLKCRYEYPAQEIPRKYLNGETQEEVSRELYLNIMVLEIYFTLKILEYYLAENLRFDLERGFGVSEKNFLGIEKVRYLSPNEVINYLKEACNQGIEPWITLKGLIVDAQENVKKRFLKKKGK